MEEESLVAAMPSGHVHCILVDDIVEMEDLQTGIRYILPRICVKLRMHIHTAETKALLLLCVCYPPCTLLAEPENCVNIRLDQPLGECTSSYRAAGRSEHDFDTIQSTKMGD